MDLEGRKSQPDIDRPALTRVEFYGYIIYFIASLSLLLPYVNSNYCHFDEMMLLSEARRVLQGEVQHRDFFSFYGTGQFWVVAAVWKLQGAVTYQSIKLLTYASITLGAVVLLLTTRYFTRNFWLSLIPSAIFLNYQAQIFPFSNHHWFGSVSSIIFFYFVVRFLHNLRLSTLYWVGLSTGLSLLFIMSEGLVNLLASLIMLFTLAILTGRRLTGYGLVRALTVYLAGLATMMLPIFIYYIAQGVFVDYLYNTFLWPFNNYARKNNVNDLPWAVDVYYWRFGSGRFIHWIYFFSSCALYLLLLIPVGVFVINAGLLTAPSSLSSFCRWSPITMLTERLKGADTNLQTRYYGWILLILLVMAGGLYATPLRAQPEFNKLLWGSLRAYVVAVFFYQSLWHFCTQHLGLRRVLMLFLAFCWISLLTAGLYNGLNMLRGDESQLNTPETNRMIEQPVVDLINSETSPTDYIFAYKYSLTFLYFTSHARPATPFTLMAEGYLTPKQELQVATDLQAKKPKFMIFSNEADMMWVMSLHPDMINWFNQNYQLRGKTEGLLLYQRKT